MTVRAGLNRHGKTEQLKNGKHDWMGLLRASDRRLGEKILRSNRHPRKRAQHYLIRRNETNLE